MKIRRPFDKPVRIEMLPLIDIVFLLLVFFIYAMLSMSVHRGRQVELPASPASEVHPAAPISVTLGRGTNGPLLQVEEASLPLEELESVLQRHAERLLRAGQTPTVQLFAAHDLPYQQVYRVLDRIQQAGITSIILQSRPDDGR